MAFLLYNRTNGKLTKSGEYYSLAGLNLIYKLWNKRKKPTDQGWHIKSDDLIVEHTKGQENILSKALLIDFHPSSRNRIGIIELLDIYAFTYSGATQNDAGWTPMMLRLRNIFYEEYDNEISQEEKETKIQSLNEPEEDEEFIEFLYLNGSDKSWNWGRNGMTNAAFIHKPARTYFRQYF